MPGLVDAKAVSGAVAPVSKEKEEGRPAAAAAVVAVGAEPEGESKFTDDELLKTRTVVMRGDDVEAKRAEIREYFHRTFTLFERLHDVLANDRVFYQQPDKLRHPLIFYLCHTAVLYINKCRLAKLLPRIDEKIESMCAVGVDEMSWDDLNEGHYDWPAVDAARDYRNKVRVAVDCLIQTMPLTLPITWESPWWVILLGIEHERIHLETSSVLIRQLPIELVRPSPLWKICSELRRSIESVPANELKAVPGGRVKLGKPFDHPLYGWDLEYGHSSATVGAFNASKFLVSNAEFYQFVADRGYETKEHWTSDGWQWVTWKKAKWPLFWRPVYGEAKAGAAVPAGSDSPEERPIVSWRYRAYAEEIDMPWDWPVDCNQLEAKAFCNWKAAKTGKKIRLPTEEEWTQLRDTAYPDTKENDQPYWTVAPQNINLEHGASSCPIDKFELNGFYDVFGNVWQHTETALVPFTDFKIHPIYDDFSVPTFDTRHNVIKGGSWISTGNEATRLARFAFRRHFYQHAGFRYVESSEPVVVKEQPPPVLPETAQWAEVHFGAPYLGVPNYPAALVNTIMKTIETHEKRMGITVTAEPFTPTVETHSTVFSSLPSVTPTAAAETKEKKADAKVDDWAPKPSSTVITGVGAVGTAGRRRALDMGCAAGRASLELAKHYHAVLGLDFSTRLFRVASVLQSEGVFRYELPLSGDISSFHSIDLAAIEGGALRDAARRCEFLQADACNIDPKYKDFDLVLASNLLTSLYAPAQFLACIRARLRPGAYLAIADTWEWNEKVTPKKAWLGGYKEAGENVTNLDGLERALGREFALIAPPTDLPWTLRNAERSFSYHISQLTIWKFTPAPPTATHAPAASS